MSKADDPEHDSDCACPGCRNETETTRHPAKPGKVAIYVDIRWESEDEDADLVARITVVSRRGGYADIQRDFAKRRVHLSYFMPDETKDGLARSERITLQDQVSFKGDGRDRPRETPAEFYSRFRVEVDLAVRLIRARVRDLSGKRRETHALKKERAAIIKVSRLERAANRQATVEPSTPRADVGGRLGYS